MTAERFLIVNADDFGQSAAINRGVIRGFEEGIVTSATLMVRWPAAEDAAAYAQAHRDLSVGLHLDLGEWQYTQGEWRPRYEVVEIEDPSAVETEVRSQLDAFRRLVGRDPTHLDSHQHVHRHQPARSSLTRAGERLGVPVRDQSGSVRYRGDFYGQDGRGWPVADAITVEALIRVLAGLPAGITELGCHPGESEDLASTYGAERVEEVKTLCDDRVRAAVVALGIQLLSFAEVASARGPV